MKKYVLIFTLVFVQLAVVAQSTNWGDNKPEAEKRWNYMRIQTSSQLYSEAHKQAYWLLNHAPLLSEDLYILSSSIYENLERSEKDDARKVELQDSVLAIYNKRLELYDDSAEIYNRMGLVAFKYLNGRQGETENLYELYQNIYSINGPDAYDANIYYYFFAAGNYAKQDGLSEEEFIELYNELTTEYENRSKATPAKASVYENRIAQMDKVLNTIVEMDCEQIKNLYAAKLSENSKDVKTAKFVYSKMLHNKCYDEPLLTKAAYILSDNDPSASRYRTIGNIEKSNKNFDNAITAYNNAIAIETDAEKKAETFLLIGELYKAMGNKSQARTYANKALATGQNTSEAHTLIGDLYLYSYNDCTSDDKVVSRSVYIAAYDEYKKAGNTSKMKTAKQNFPSAEEIFYTGREVGQTVNTGCWINEDVVIEKR